MEVKPGYKLTEVGVIPEDWEMLRLGGLSVFATSGSRGWARHYSETGPLFVRSQNVRDGQLDFTDRQCVIPPAGTEGSRTRLNREDLLITMTGNSVGNVAWVEQDLGEAYISQHVGLVRLRDPSLAEFACRFLMPGSPGNWQIWASQAGQSKPGLNLKNLSDFWVACPPLSEQRAIAAALNDVDALLGVLDRLIAKKRDLKQAAMQQLLTGQTRLPGFHGEWEVKRLGECGEVIMGQSPPGASYNQNSVGTPLINGPTEFTDRNPIKIQWTSEPARFCKSGDLLICVRGSSTGRTNYANDDYAIGRGVAAIRAKGCNNTDFMSYQVISGVSEILAAATGSTFPSVDGATFKKIAIPLPPPPEQAAIAAVLTDMDAELLLLEQRLAKTRDLKQGMMQELLTGRTRLV